MKFIHPAETLGAATVAAVQCSANRLERTYAIKTQTNISIIELITYCVPAENLWSP